MTCMSTSIKTSKFGFQVSFQSLWSSPDPCNGGKNLQDSRRFIAYAITVLLGSDQVRVYKLYIVG